MLELLGVAFVGMISSLIGSFAGGGASLILFPLLLMFVPGSYAGLLAITKTSAAAMTIVSGKIHHGRRGWNGGLLFALISGQFLGTSFGTYLVQYQLDETLFKKILAVTLLGSALYLVFGRERVLEHDHARPVEMDLLVLTFLFSLVSSVLNGLFGGMGMFTTIFLVLVFRMGFITAVGYTVLSCGVINILQALYLLATERPGWELVIAVSLGSVFGSWIGTHLQYLKGEKWVKRAAILVMFVLGVKVALW